MMIVGVLRGTSSLTRIRISSSTMLIVTLLVPYKVVRSCTCESDGIVGRFIHWVVEWGFLIAVMVALSVAYATIDRWGWCGGYMCSIGDSVNEPSIVRMRGYLYVLIILVISWSKIVRLFGVRWCVLSYECSCGRTFYQKLSMKIRGVDISVLYGLVILGCICTSLREEHSEDGTIVSQDVEL